MYVIRDRGNHGAFLASCACLPSYFHHPLQMSTSVKDGSSPVFEFTKRKRWADLLITELADTIILVLSAECKVLFCGPSVNEILGWQDAELLNRDLCDFISRGLIPVRSNANNNGL